MKPFFNVITPNQLLAHIKDFPCVDCEKISIDHCMGRVIAEDIVAMENIPSFRRSTMDGYAVKASSTFGASESNPAFFFIKENIGMGEVPQKKIGLQEVSKIATGGMLPEGADSVVMIEYTDMIDDTTIELYKSVAPLQHVIDIGEDMKKGSCQCQKGEVIRPQDMGALAALGINTVTVYQKPKVAIISTGDEIVPIDQQPAHGQIRDINRYTLFGQVLQNDGIPTFIGHVPDDKKALKKACSKAIQMSDMIIISGGSSVGMRDFTIDVIQSFEHARILAHGISIQPGKPTILASLEKTMLWGLPGHVTSAMIVFNTLVRPFLRHIAGETAPPFYAQQFIQARLTRNIASGQGREEYVRVRLEKTPSEILAFPIQGKSGLIRTMVQADGIVVVPENSEGLDEGICVDVLLY